MVAVVAALAHTVVVGISLPDTSQTRQHTCMIQRMPYLRVCAAGGHVVGFTGVVVLRHGDWGGTVVRGAAAAGSFIYNADGDRGDLSCSIQ